MLASFNLSEKVVHSESENEYVVLPSDSALIMENFSRQEECWNNEDLACYVEAYHPKKQVQTISRAGVTKGKKAVLDQYQRYYPSGRMGHLHFDEIELKRISEEYYYVVGRFNLKYQTPDTLFQGWFSVLMQRYENKWFMVSDHSS
ncbi:MAG: hypothetical protein RIC95_03055 [Vicingaceae bacterium]